MKHPAIANNTTSTLSKDVPKISMTITEALYTGIGCGASMMSKRLSAPMTIHNASICTDDGACIWHGDLHLPTSYRAIMRTAALFDVVLYVCPEQSGRYLWRSDWHDYYLGFCEVNNVKYPKNDIEHIAPVKIEEDYTTLSEYVQKTLNENFIKIKDAMPFFEKMARRKQRQWLLDHGFVNRNLFEVLYDWKWGIKFSFTKLKWKLEKFF